MANMLTDLFTGQPIKDAAGQNRNTLLNAQGSIGNIADITRQYGEDAIRQGYGGARQDLTAGYGASTGAINQGAQGAQDYLTQGQNGAMGQIDQARAGLTANGGAYAPLTGLAERYKQGAMLYGDSLGINGPEGSARAQAAYTKAPSFDATYNSGIDAINRRANAAGMLVGGNANRDAIQFAHDLSMRDYGSWQDRLRGIGDQELTATGQAAAGNQANNTTVAGLGVQGANIINQGGVNRAGVATTQGQNLSDIARAYYTGQAGLDTAEGGALNQNMTNAGQWNVNAQLGLAPGIGKTFMDEGQASVNGSANGWKLGMDLAKMAAGAAGGASGGGGSSFLPSMSFMQNGFTSGPGSQGVW
jgi:hypothetical protein